MKESGIKMASVFYIQVLVLEVIWGTWGKMVVILEFYTQTNYQTNIRTFSVEKNIPQKVLPTFPFIGMEEQNDVFQQNESGNSTEEYMDSEQERAKEMPGMMEKEVPGNSWAAHLQSNSSR